LTRVFGRKAVLGAIVEDQKAQGFAGLVAQDQHGLGLGVVR
jgi:ribosome biogenesis protein Nip4